SPTSPRSTLFPYTTLFRSRLRRQYGDELDAMTTGELLAMQSLINQRLDKVTEQQLASETKPTNNPDASLSLGDLSRIAEENHRRHYNFLCSLAVQLEEWFESPEARSATLAQQGKEAIQAAPYVPYHLIRI